MASRESSLLFSLERGPGIALQAMQEQKALSSRGWGRFRGFLELLRPWGFSPEARRGSQGASRAAPGKSGLHARGEGERVMALESREGTRASRCVEEGLSRSLSGGGGKPSFPSPSAGDLRELPRVPLRGEGSCVVGGASWDSAVSGATEEGLTLRGGRNLRLPLRFGLRPQGPCSLLEEICTSPDGIASNNHSFRERGRNLLDLVFSKKYILNLTKIHHPPGQVMDLYITQLQLACLNLNPLIMPLPRVWWSLKQRMPQ